MKIVLPRSEQIIGRRGRRPGYTSSTTAPSIVIPNPDPSDVRNQLKSGIVVIAVYEDKTIARDSAEKKIASWANKTKGITFYSIPFSEFPKLKSSASLRKRNAFLAYEDGELILLSYPKNDKEEQQFLDQLPKSSEPVKHISEPLDGIVGKLESGLVVAVVYDQSTEIAAKNSIERMTEVIINSPRPIAFYSVSLDDYNKLKLELREKYKISVTPFFFASENGREMSTSKGFFTESNNEGTFLSKFLKIVDGTAPTDDSDTDNESSEQSSEETSGKVPKSSTETPPVSFPGVESPQEPIIGGGPARTACNNPKWCY